MFQIFKNKETGEIVKGKFVEDTNKKFIAIKKESKKFGIYTLITGYKFYQLIN